MTKMKKTWSKPVIETVAVESAQAGGFNSTDAKHTHRS